MNVALYSPSLNRTYGNFTVNTSAMSTGLQIFTGTLLGTAFATKVPTTPQPQTFTNYFGEARSPPPYPRRWQALVVRPTPDLASAPPSCCGLLLFV